MRLFLISILLLLPCVSNAEKLSSINDPKLKQILASYELLAETPNSSKLFARILRVQEPGECDGSPSSCPKSTLYIAVSSIDEFPEQKLYQLPEGYNWEFVGWVSLPETSDPPSNLVFKVKSQSPNKDLKKSWWVDKTYTIKVNYHEGSWVKQ